MDVITIALAVIAVLLVLFVVIPLVKYMLWLLVLKHRINKLNYECNHSNKNWWCEW